MSVPFAEVSDFNNFWPQTINFRNGILIFTESIRLRCRVQ
jgi:hypothetical protein